MFKYIVLCCLAQLINLSNSAGPPTLVGESPFWRDGSLYYVDMLARTLNRFSLNEDRVYAAKVPDFTGFPGFVVPIQDNPDQYLAGLGDTATIINWDGHSPVATKAGELITGPLGTNINSLLVSPENDIYAGNYANGFCFVPPHQSVFGLLRNKHLNTFASDMGSSIGMALIEATNTVYQIDSCHANLNSFKWDRSTGELHDEQLVLRFDTTDSCMPAGIAADKNGHLYVGAYGGGYVMQIDPIRREIIHKFHVPAQFVTGTAFGGPNFDILFVTTALTPIDFLHTGNIGNSLPPPAGQVFQIPMNVQGVQQYLPRV